MRGLIAWVLLGMSAQAAADSLIPDIRYLDELPLHSAPVTPKLDEMQQAQAAKGEGPALFAATVPLSIGLDGGVWDQLDPDTLRWRMRVYSSGARSVLLYLSEFHVPPGATLWLYDAAGAVVRGPYRSQGVIDEAGLWTATVPGEFGILELRVPAMQRSEVQLKIGRVGHAFKSIAQLGEAGACEIDSACSVGNAWQDESRSTVKLQIPVDFGVFVGYCTGTLVNNTAQDSRPFILTASHCGIGDLGSPASGVVTYWNFRNTQCGVDDASARQTQTGAILRAHDPKTDFALIELTQPAAPGAEVFYSGWDASGYGGQYGVGIHHPAGDAEKISEFTSPLTAQNVQISAVGQIPAWKVASWNQGATEPGSSGSGLWNEQHQLVGVLSGGRAACVGLLGNGQPDYYARFDRQWEGQGEPSAQLKAWLDPGGTGCVSLDGKSGTSPQSSGCRKSTGTDEVAASSDGGGGAVSWWWCAGVFVAAWRRALGSGRRSLREVN